jgi:hypothetical protein
MAPDIFIPMPRPDIPVTRAAVLEFTRKKNDVSEYDHIAQTLMSDYARKIKELKAVLENTQVETALLLRPYDVTRVQNPITEDITDWSAEQYVQAVKERTASAPKRQKRAWLPFLGNIAGTIFGVTTEEYVTVLHYGIA